MVRETALFILGLFSSFVDPRGPACVISEQVITFVSSKSSPTIKLLHAPKQKFEVIWWEFIP